MRVSLARNPFSFLFASSKREQYVGRYVIRECARGRSLEDVLADPYVRNRSTPEERARLLEQPEIVEAIGEHTVAEMKRTLGRDEAPVGAKT
ncbi:MAG TPA: hypothetical protein VJ986_13370 [Gaiellaceae bacterium]|nr:hypothetical protein [Gaiellaceae bacterium]